MLKERPGINRGLVGSPGDGENAVFLQKAEENVTGI